MSPIDPPYPSFTLVLTAPQPRNNRSNRLPAYRASHMGRYHPYARAAPGRCEDRLMNTIDYRYGEEPLWEESLGEEGAPECEGSSDSENAVSSVGDVEHVNVEEPPTPTGPADQLSRSKLVDTLAEVLVVLRRRYLTLQALRSFLKAQQLKGPRA